MVEDQSYPHTESPAETAPKEPVVGMLDAMLAATPVGLCFVDRQLRYVRINEALAAMNGVPLRAHLGRTVREVIPQFAPTLEPLLQRVFTTGQPTGNLEVSGESAAHPGERRYWEINYFPVPDPSGEVTLVGAAAVDVTAHKRAVEGLRQSQALVTQVLESLPVGVWMQDADGRITRVNRAGQEIWRGVRYVGPEQFGEYKGWWVETGQPIAPEEWAGARAIRRGETSLNELIEIQCFDGSRKTILNSAMPLRDADGRITGGIIVNQDVSELRQAQAAAAAQAALAHERLAELEATYATAPVGLCVLDRELRYVRVNQRLAELNGSSAAEHIGRSIFEIVPDVAPKVAPLLRRVLKTGEPFLDMEVEGQTMAQPGLERTWVNHWLPLRDAAGEIIGINIVAEEITERKRTEEALRTLQRLNAVGRLAGGIAHEANNQMTVVLGTAAFLLRRADLAAEAREDLQHIRRAAERTAAITQQLLAFSRRQVLRPEPLDLNSVVREFEPLLSRTLSERCHVELRLAPGEVCLVADRGQVEQVLLHLAFNARDAMPQGGTLTVETATAELSAGFAADKGVVVRPGSYVMLAVSDTGHGMEGETLQQLFEPFFTTKGVGQGTGLGLSTVYGVVKQSGGYIWADSTAGRGATFRIYLPAAEPRPGAGQLPQAELTHQPPAHLVR